jgi:hypothetical protein
LNQRVVQFGIAYRSQRRCLNTKLKKRNGNAKYAVAKALKPGFVHKTPFVAFSIPVNSLLHELVTVPEYCSVAPILIVSRANATTVTIRHSRVVGPGKQSLDATSSNQSSADNFASSGPNNSVTALVNAANSRSAETIWELQS